MSQVMGHSVASRDRGARPFALTVIGNAIAFWNRERVGIELTPGLDEVSLALVADAWSRTYRSRALTFAPTGAPLESRNGVRIVPDRIAPTWPVEDLLSAIHGALARPEKV